MPTDSCVFFHECAGCGTLLRPKPGDCCVFCSFGSVRCPMEQKVGPNAPTRIELIQNAKKLLAERYGVPPEVIMLGSSMGEERDRARRDDSGGGDAESDRGQRTDR
jgi:hypothetical protein